MSSVREANLNDGGCVRQSEFAGKATIAGEPVDLARDGDGSFLDAPVSLVEFGAAVEGAVGSVGEVGFDLGAQGRLVGLDCKEIVSAFGSDVACDPGICGDGIDGDDCPLEAAVFTQAFEE